MSEIKEVKWTQKLYGDITTVKILIGNKWIRGDVIEELEDHYRVKTHYSIINIKKDMVK